MDREMIRGFAQLSRAKAETTRIVCSSENYTARQLYLDAIAMGPPESESPESDIEQAIRMVGEMKI